MRTTLFVPALALAACSTAMAQQPSAEESAVRDVIRRYVDAREASDPRAIEARSRSQGGVALRQS